MKRIIYGLIAIVFVFYMLPNHTFAAITEQQLNEVLTEKGWDRDKFNEFLNYYELTLNDFDTKEDLSEMIGTPITEENMNQLLTDYGLSRKDLDVLLGEFGMKVEDHWSIEELDASIDFYINHQEEMNEMENFLSAIGITDQEGDNLFKHFEALDQMKLEEQMEKMGSRLEALITLDPEAELTDKQLEEVISVWEDMMKIVNLYPKFYLVEGHSKVPVTFKQLAFMKDFHSDALLIELFDEKNSLLLDMQVSKEMLSSDFVIHSASKLINIGNIAGELTKLRHGELPNTASPYGMNILIGLSIMLFGLLSLYFRKLSVKQQK